MKLIVISNPVSIKNEAKIITTFFQEGLEYFHLRKPGMTPEGIDLWLNKIPIEYHHKIIIHSHYELVFKYDLKGIHYNRWYKSEITPEVLKIKNLNYSSSIHSLEEILNYSQNYIYIFLGPVFDSISKKNLKSFNFNPAELRSAIKKSRTEIIALGGISPQTIPLANDYGFKGVAVLGNIWNDTNPISAFSKIIDTCNRFPN